jgi:chromosome segregation ATPase
MYTKENIVSVIFSDKDRANLTVKYRNGSTNQIIPFAVEYNPESNQIKELESWGWTYDRIVDSLAEDRLAYQRAINKIVDDRVNMQLKDIMSKMKKSNETYLQKLRNERNVELQKLEESKNSELQKIKESRNSELKKIRIEREAELEKLKKSRLSELKKLKQSRDSELTKLKESKDSELKKIKNEQKKIKTNIAQKDREIDQLSKDKSDILDQLAETKKEQITFFENWVNDTLLMNTEPEALFKFKLAFFEIEQIKKTDSNFKRRLRKAKSVIECFSILNEIYVEPPKS